MYILDISPLSDTFFENIFFSQHETCLFIFKIESLEAQMFLIFKVEVFSYSVLSDTLRPHGLYQPTRICP